MVCHGSWVETQDGWKKEGSKETKKMREIKEEKRREKI
jgi:hypothetical protein